MTKKAKFNVSRNMPKIRDVKMIPTDVSMTHDWYDIECECGEDFNVCVAFDDEEEMCPDCNRKYKLIRTISITLI